MPTNNNLWINFNYQHNIGQGNQIVIVCVP